MSIEITNWKHKFVKTAVLVAGAAMTMGNQKCQQQPQARTLKKIVDVSGVTSAPIRFPDGSSFDFQYVANQQIYGVLQESNEFAFKAKKTFATSPAQVTQAKMTTGADIKMFNLSDADTAMMKASALQAGKEVDTQYAKTAWCMANLPQARLSGSVNSFEMIGGGGISLGFTPAGPVPSVTLGSASVNIEQAQMDFSMMATRPLSSTVIAAANVNSKQTKTKLNFTINFGVWSVGPSAYYQTPLATVTKKALTTAVGTLSKQMASDAWFTRILANHDTHLMVVGGSDVKLEVGDQLLVYNEEYYWDGEPCNSNYLGGGAAAGSAVAKIEIDWVGDEISRGKVIEQSDYNAVVGAKVKLFKMHAADYVPPSAGVQDPSNDTSSSSGSGSSSGSATAPSTGNSSKPTGGR